MKRLIARLHLSFAERLKFEALFDFGASLKEIAVALKRSYCTITREFKRGKVEQRDSVWKLKIAYSAAVAQLDYDYKAQTKGAPLKIDNDFDFSRFIEDKILRCKFSPAAALAAANEENFATHLSKTTLYRYIENGVLNVTNADLIEGKRPYKKAEKHKAQSRNILKPSITDRPADAETRLTFGHWEMDTVIGKKAGVNPVLLVLTERKTRQEFIIKIARKTSENVVKAFGQLARGFGEYSSDVFKSVTMDNGAEFSDFLGINLVAPAFYCHAYKSCERGSNERQNRLIRRFFGKGSDFLAITEKNVKAAETWINDYPRKILKWKSSKKLFDEEIARLHAFSSNACNSVAIIS